MAKTLGYIRTQKHRDIARKTRTGVKMSEFTRNKISQNRKGKGLGNKGRLGVPPWNKGKKLSEEIRKKFSISHLGQTHKRHTPESRKKIGEYHKGEKATFWKGGISPINKLIRSSLEYKLWREAVFKRDNYQCIWGGKEHGNRLQVDHIKPFSLFPVLRFAIDNGRTLCENCHKKTDTYGWKLLNKQTEKEGF